MSNHLKNLPKFVSVPLLIIFIIGLYWSLNRVVVPFVLKVVASDVFFETDTEQEELGKISNERTGFAFSQCKTAMKEANHVPEGSRFADADYEAWALGGKMYLIRSHVNVTSDAGMVDKKYACKIKFAGGDLADAGNWSILGIDFNDEAK
jgi:glutamate formiminotransferase